MKTWNLDNLKVTGNQVMTKKIIAKQVITKRRRRAFDIRPLHFAISMINVPLIIATLMALSFNLIRIEQTFAQSEEAAPLTITLEAPAQVAVGEVIPLRLRVAGDVMVGGFEAQLLYDRPVLEFAGFSPPPPGDLGMGQLIVPEMATGSVVGFYTCPTEPCLSQREVQAQAASEVGLLGAIELLPLTAGEVELRIGHLQIVDATGQPIAATIAQPAVMVRVGEGGEVHNAPATAAWTSTNATAAAVSATQADLTQDGTVTHADLMEVALAWQVVHETGEPCADYEANTQEASADLNGDGCVDIVDVQSAAAFAGQEGPTTEEPRQWSRHTFLPQINGNQAGSTDYESAASEGNAQVAAPLTFVVNSTLDEYDAKSSDNKCLSPSGVCTLRAAIQQSNSHAGTDTILFAIPGGGVQTIQLGSRLPSLWDASGGTIVDGYSQPGASPNSDATISNAQIKVQIRGNGSEDYDGMVITSAGNVVKGLSFFNLKRSLWVYGAGAHNNTIVGNFIGIDVAGISNTNITSQQQAHGVHLEQGATNNRVGDILPADRNVISGNARHGVGFWHVGTTGNVIYNNIIGLSPDGTRRVANRLHGADINYGASNNTVGGIQPGQRNIISGNAGSGAEISHGGTTKNNLIRGNYIGTFVTGMGGAGYTANNFYGVSLKDRVVDNMVEDNVIGNSVDGGVRIDNFGNCCTSNNTVRNNRIGISISGSSIGNSVFGIRITAPNSNIGPGNIIANNPIGIQIEGDTSDGNTITQNSIFANSGLGIDLAPDFAQVNANDEGDADSGANQQLNFPVLQSATPSQVTGSGCANCTVEIFLADASANAYGEGRTFVGTGITTGDGTFTINLSGVSGGNHLTATATDSEGNTSEFSQNILVSGGQPWEQPFTLPGRLEAENYRNGGQGTGYSDSTAGNSGRAYRTDDVDIEVTQDIGGNYNLGWMAPNEWLAYDIIVPNTGNYNFVVRTATPAAGRRFHLEIDGNNVSGSVAVPWTGNYQTWASVSVVVPLTAGPHVLRFVAETDRFNLNYFDISAQ